MINNNISIQIYNEILNILEDKKYDDINYSGDFRGDIVKRITDKKGMKLVMDCLIAIFLDKNKKQYWKELTTIICNAELDENYILGSGKENQFIAILLYCAEYSSEFNFYSRETIWPFIRLFKDVYIEADYMPKENTDGYYRYYNPYEDDEIIKELKFLQNKYGK